MIIKLTIAAVVVAGLAHFGSIAVLLLRSWLHRDRTPTSRPPITILRPACGIENHVEETLASAFAIDYPEFEILFCVADSNDPVIALIERLMKEHPQVPSRLLVGDDRISINPKLNNTVKGWKAARYEWIVMADSNVLIPPDYLDRVLERWKSDTGLVCSPPVGTEPEDIGADLECAFLNTYEARWQLFADSIGFAFAQGKTMFWRRDILEAGGGIEALASEPAEDAASTKLIRAGGRHVRLVVHPFPQPLGTRHIKDVWNRQLRWARLRRSSFPIVYAPELLTGGFLPLAGTAALAFADVIPFSLFLGAFVAWYGAEVALAKRYGWPVSARLVLMMVLRDLLMIPLWIGGWTGNKFVWRGNAMDIKTPAGAELPPFVERLMAARTVRAVMQIVTGRRPVADMERGNGASRGG